MGCSAGADPAGGDRAGGIAVPEQRGAEFGAAGFGDGAVAAVAAGAADVISAKAQPDFEALATALEAMAGDLAAAHAQAAADAQAQDPIAWRDAARLWPLFAAHFSKG